MTLTRLELLRLVRTHRWMILFGLYAFFGVLGPVTARYMSEILSRFGGGLEFTVPDPTPVDGLVQFVSNATQLGVLAIVVVAAGSLAVDAKPELAAFLRTRVRQPWRLLGPRYGVVTAASVGALVAGTALAWGLTTGLIGSLPAGATIAGTVLGALFVAFVVAVVAAAAAVARSMLATILMGLAAVIVLPIIGIVPAIQPWLPTTLATAVVELASGTPLGDFARAAGVTLVVTPALLWFAAVRWAAREL